jgi:carbon-monoxide dehydrogenase medium subunit
MLPEFEFITPRDLPEALKLLAEYKSAAAPIAGGTNLIPDMRSERHQPKVVLNIEKLPELKGIMVIDQSLYIGAGVTITELLKNPLIAQYAPGLKQAASVFANPLIRNRATVGGNISDASPASDTAPSLLALDARVELASIYGTRVVPITEFFTGVRKTDRKPDELVVSIQFDITDKPASMAFYKLGLRKADAISVISVGVRLESDGDHTCQKATIALGSVAPRPVRAYKAEEILKGQKLDQDLIEKASLLAVEASSPITDVRSTASYRRRMVQVLTRRLLQQTTQALWA